MFWRWPRRNCGTPPFAGVAIQQIPSPSAVLPLPARSRLLYIPVPVHARAEPLNTSNRLLGGHRRRQTQFGRTRSQGLCRWAVPGLAIFVPPGVSWSPRGLFLNQIGNRVVRSGSWLLGPVPLFLFLQGRAVPGRTGRGNGGQPRCVAVGTGSLRRSVPQNRARRPGAPRLGREASTYPRGSDSATGRDYEGNSLRLETAVTRELQCPAVLRYRPNDVVGSAFRDLRFDFERNLHL